MGRAVAERFLDEGWDVVGVDLNADALAELAALRGRAYHPVHADITDNAVAPGWVDTPGTRAGGRIEEAIKTVPLGRAARPDEIADWVWKLCHGSYLTGETLVISGGLTVR